jgi:hypothetical protein
MRSLSRTCLAACGALALAVGLSACGGRGGPEVREARDQVGKLAGALDMYCLGQARYPESITDPAVAGQLTNLVVGLSFTDPWGRPIGYASTGPGNCEVWSAGPDGLAGTPDDIRVRRGAAAP